MIYIHINNFGIKEVQIKIILGDRMLGFGNIGVWGTGNIYTFWGVIVIIIIW